MDWTKPAETLSCLVRAFNPWPVAYTQMHGVTVRVWQANALTIKTKQAPGTIVAVSKTGLDIATGEGGVLRLLSLQWPGGKPHSITDVLNAHQHEFNQGDTLA